MVLINFISYKCLFIFPINARLKFRKLILQFKQLHHKI